MIVCVCHAVSVPEVAKTIEAGASTVQEVTRACKAGGDCGACRQTIEDMIESHESSDLVTCRRSREAA